VKFKLGEFFCGPGGIALGAKFAGEVISETGEGFSIEHLWATDYDLDTCKTYSLNVHGEDFEKSDKVIHSDIRNLDFSLLNRVDGFAFGFPCNDFSLVGKSKGLEGKYGPLYSYGVKLLRIQKPMWFIAENVGGLSSANEGNAFKLIMDELKLSGYTLVAHLYKFEQYGVPQARHRYIIVGIRNDLSVTFKVPAPSHLKNYRSSKDAITNPSIKKDAFNNEFTKQSDKVVERLKYIGPGENAWSEKIPQKFRLNVNGAKLSNIYKRLHPDQPAYTVTGSGGGGTHMYHWEEHRALTNRERARLQTFPDDFMFCGSKENVRKQIGMAVPPEGMKVIFEALLKTFAGIDYISVAPSINE
jgi:DNA (cytosine-5)-methyltransferase 1